MTVFDAVIVGGGIGGYPAAVELARNGLKTAIVSEGLIGGECTNYGCIPTKALISSITHGSSGWNKALRFAREAVIRSRNGLEEVLRLYRVKIYRERARLALENGVYKILLSGGGVLEAPRVLVATGSSPRVPRVLRGLRRVLDNRSILLLEKAPRSMLIIGGGAVGVEYARILSTLGVKVYLVEMMHQVLPGFPRDLSRQVAKGLSGLGVELHLSTVVEEVAESGEGLDILLSDGSRLKAEYILNATGRVPNTSGIGLEDVGVELSEEGYIKINAKMETSSDGVYAAGDVTGPPMLAHKAYHQSLVAAENMMGGDRVFDKPVPVMVFSYPEVAYVGMSWSEARKKGLKASRKRIPLSFHTRSFIEGWSEGFARIVYLEDTGAVIGFEMAGPLASELVGLASILVSLGVSIWDLGQPVIPHPSMVELFTWLFEAARGKPIHFYEKPRP